MNVVISPNAAMVAESCQQSYLAFVRRRVTYVGEHRNVRADLRYRYHHQTLCLHSAHKTSWGIAVT